MAKESSVSNGSVEIETLILAVNKAEEAYDAAKAKLNTKIVSVPLGTIYTIGDLKYEVSQKVLKKGEPMSRILKPCFTARQLAVLRGETPPPPRFRKTKAEVEAEKAAAAKAAE